jgi:hypothetical protein
VCWRTWAAERKKRTSTREIMIGLRQLDHAPRMSNLAQSFGIRRSQWCTAFSRSRILHADRAPTLLQRWLRAALSRARRQLLTRARWRAASAQRSMQDRLDERWLHLCACCAGALHASRARRERLGQPRWMKRACLLVIESIVTVRTSSS